MNMEERSVRALIYVAALAISATAVEAQSTTSPAAKRSTSEAAVLDEKARVRECIKQWDRSTHMTKREWESTCRRVAGERIKYLWEQGYGSEGKKPATRGKSSQM